MSQYTEKIDKLTLPVVPLGDAVAFPPFPIDFESDSKEAAAAVEAAAGAGMMVFLVSEDSELAENEFTDNICRVGTVAKIRQSVKNDGSIFFVNAAHARQSLITDARARSQLPL